MVLLVWISLDSLCLCETQTQYAIVSSKLLMVIKSECSTVSSRLHREEGAPGESVNNRLFTLNKRNLVSEIRVGTEIKSKPVYLPVVHPGHRKDRAVAIAICYSAETLR